MEARARRLLAVLLFLAGAAGVVLILEARPRPQPTREPFQRMVGGLGFGPVLDLSGCAFGFDPRLDGSCSAAVGPVPGGSCFCGRHGGLFSYPPLRTGPACRGDGDATPP